MPGRRDLSPPKRCQPMQVFLPREKHTAASRSPGGQAAHGQTIPTVGSLQVDLDPARSVPALSGYQAGDRAQQGGRTLTLTCACPKETGYGFPRGGSGGRAVPTDGAGRRIYLRTGRTDDGNHPDCR